MQVKEILEKERHGTGQGIKYDNAATVHTNEPKRT